MYEEIKEDLDRLCEEGCTVVACKAACCMEVRKENVVALQPAEMRMVRWMCVLTAEQAAMAWACVAKRR